ncbi:acyl-CoA thioesterase [Saccharomonospora piscinae]|uniref:Thioesterase n=1 Tax=Saccharomonospora piscinae TaxID=687388 RepID=A0A1V9A7C4_SACPI|nr:thioesterase family protein [Saccharomonospora piscinae]OQO92993.1 thioesterase [Saccharomonospora piscinae]TLW93132.1 acyl-CoA thioesterase [Saccharomonospora piscinae]
MSYAHWEIVPTRWKDNDVYGHVNNVVHYAFMDTVINNWLITKGGLDIADGQVIGLCVESHCNYHAAVSYPEALAVGLRVGHLGRTSVRYELGLHRQDRSELVAQGHFVHVFVDRATRRPVEITGQLREALTALLVS